MRMSHPRIAFLISSSPNVDVPDNILTTDNYCATSFFINCEVEVRFYIVKGLLQDTFSFCCQTFVLTEEYEALLVFSWVTCLLFLQVLCCQISGIIYHIVLND